MYSSLFLILFLQIYKNSGTYVFPIFHFIEEPKDVSAKENESVLLNCVVQSSSFSDTSPTLEWKRNGERLVFNEFGDTRRLLGNGSLFFSNLHQSKSSDKGIYQCVAHFKDVGTLVSRFATIARQDHLRFLAEPSNITVYLGQRAAFECRTNNNIFDPLTPCNWMKDHQPLVTDHRMKISSSCLLEISTVILSDRAEYKCKVGENESQTGILNIQLDQVGGARVMTAPVFLVKPKSVLAKEGESKRFDCVANGRPQPKFIWLKNGQTIDLHYLDSRFKMIGGSHLEISNIQFEDAGLYVCRALNSEDSSDASAILDVVYKPRILSEPQNTVSVVRSDIQLNCDVDGKPQPHVTWYKNGEPIVQSSFLQTSDSNKYLRILGTVESDSGVYQCICNNSVGNIQSSAQLKVINKDTFVTNSKYEDFDFLPSAPMKVNAVLIDSGFITLRWLSPEKPNGIIEFYSVLLKPFDSERERILNSTRGSLTEIKIQGLSPGTEYSIRVLAHNQNGPGILSSPYTVSTHQKPDVPNSIRDLNCQGYSSVSLKLYWKPPLHLTGVIEYYNLYFRENENVKEESIRVTSLEYHLKALKKFTEYSFRVSAFNENGEGSTSEKVTCKTYSDIPSEPPNNVTLESSSSSKSLIVRWEPPFKDSQNGIISGYKIRWKRKSEKHLNGITTDGTRRHYSIGQLSTIEEIRVKVAAMTSNGTGPYTVWNSIITFEKDLYENIVPNQPSSLVARPIDNEITILWTPPSDSKILVRGYKIGWGKGIPDEYTELVDEKQRFFRIPKLKPNSEYVISLRASNNLGFGRPIYETVRTREESLEVNGGSPLLPPIGLHSRVLSSSSIECNWMDSSYNYHTHPHKNESFIYILRYTISQLSQNHHPHHQFKNSTTLNVVVNDLKANTEYEFTVKVLRGRRQSEWSLVVTNKTLEATPSSPPRDLTLKMNGLSLLLTWRPPKFPNGRINGYIIQYTSNKEDEERDWFVEAVVGDKTEASIDDLTSNVLYYFKVSARNNKGYGPPGPIVTFKIPSGYTRGYTSTNSSNISPMVLYAVFSVGVGIVIVLIIGAVILIRSRLLNSSLIREESCIRHNKSYLTDPLNENISVREKLNPPDLWIGHDQLELKSIDGNETTETTLPRSEYRSGSSLENSRFNSTLPYSGTESERSFSLRQNRRADNFSEENRGFKKYIQNNPSINAMTSSVPRGNESGSRLASYLRSQASSHQKYNERSPDDLPHPGYEVEESLGRFENTPTYLSSGLSSSSDHSSSESRNSRKCYKSFLTSNNSSSSFYPSSNQSKSICFPQNHSSSSSSSPFKKRHLIPLVEGIKGFTSEIHSGNLPSIPDVRSPDVFHPQEGPCDCLSHPLPQSLSTEELNADLKNLEGLMKDLGSLEPPISLRTYN